MNNKVHKLAAGLLSATMALTLLSGGALAAPNPTHGAPRSGIVANTPPKSMIYVTKIGNTVKSTLWYQPTVSGNTASVTVPDSAVTAALKDADNYGITADTKLVLIVEAASEEKSDRFKLTIPASGLKSMSDKPVTQVHITSGSGDLLFDAATAAAIAKQAGSGNVVVTVGQADAKDLSAGQKETVQDNTAYNVSIKTGSGTPAGFDDSKFSVTLPYTLKDGESADGIVLHYIDDKGAVQAMPAEYNAKAGMITFSTPLLGTFFVSYSPPVIWKNPFTDVQESDWYFDAVRNASLKGLFSGTTATTFSPNASMTRSMLVTVLWRFAGEPEAQSGGFTDVVAGTWYTKAVNWAAGQGVVSGVGNNRFDPDGTVTREQAAAILYRYAQKSGIEVPPASGATAQPDMTKVPAWAVDGVQWAVRSGMLTDRGAGGLILGEPATRAELAAMLEKLG
ncbi:MAG: S-layer homology domain-containing protein [Oscillospiraceae bacterium]